MQKTKPVSLGPFKRTIVMQGKQPLITLPMENLDDLAPFLNRKVQVEITISDLPESN